MKSTQAIDRLRQIIRRQHKALATEDCYAFWLLRYIHALHSTPTNLPSEKKLEFLHTSSINFQPLTTSWPSHRAAVNASVNDIVISSWTVREPFG